VATARKTPQRTVGIDDELWNDVQYIAKERREKVSDVIRRTLVEYRERHRRILDRRTDEAKPTA
jgi:predicted CopG family antitoxin